MAGAVISDYSSTLIKILYSPEKIENTTLARSPALGLIGKDESFLGETFKEIVEYGELQGVGKSFAATQAAVGNPSDAAFTLTRAEDYAVAKLDGWLIEATEGGAPGAKHAFASALQRHMTSALKAIGQSMSHSLYRNKYGCRGTGTVATTTVTLTDANDIVLFQVGMPLVASATDGGVLLSSTACTVATMNRAAGTFTTSVDMSGSWTGTVYLYRATDTDATTAAVSSGKSISGFRDWMPATPTATAFFGQNRALDWNALAGQRYDGSGKSLRETMVNAVATADQFGAVFETMFMRPTDYSKLENELGSNVRYAQTVAQGAKGPSATVGFSGITISGPDNQNVTIYKDRWCIGGLAFAINRDCWKIRSLNGAPHVLGKDGLQMLRAASENAYEIRWGANWQLGCSCPHNNMVITLPTT